MTKISSSCCSQGAAANLFHRAKMALNTVSVIEYWNLRFICNLVLGIWNFLFSMDDACFDFCK